MNSVVFHSCVPSCAPADAPGHNCKLDATHGKRLAPRRSQQDGRPWFFCEADHCLDQASRSVCTYCERVFCCQHLPRSPISACDAPACLMVGDRGCMTCQWTYCEWHFLCHCLHASFFREPCTLAVHGFAIVKTSQAEREAVSVLSQLAVAVEEKKAAEPQPMQDVIVGRNNNKRKSASPQRSPPAPPLSPMLSGDAFQNKHELSPRSADDAFELQHPLVDVPELFPMPEADERDPKRQKTGDDSNSQSALPPLVDYATAAMARERNRAVQAKQMELGKGTGLYIAAGRVKSQAEEKAVLKLILEPNPIRNYDPRLETRIVTDDLPYKGQLGVFTTEDIEECTPLTVYGGEMLTTPEQVAAAHDPWCMYQLGVYDLSQKKKRRLLDWTLNGGKDTNGKYMGNGIGAFINDFRHCVTKAKTPENAARLELVNCAGKVIRYEGEAFVVLFSTKKIPKGTELLLDYTMSYWRSYTKQLDKAARAAF